MFIYPSQMHKKQLPILIKSEEHGFTIWVYETWVKSRYKMSIRVMLCFQKYLDCMFFISSNKTSRFVIFKQIHVVCVKRKKKYEFQHSKLWVPSKYELISNLLVLLKYSIHFIFPLFFISSRARLTVGHSTVIQNELQFFSFWKDLLMKISIIGFTYIGAFVQKKVYMPLKNNLFWR